MTKSGFNKWEVFAVSSVPFLAMVVGGIIAHATYDNNVIPSRRTPGLSLSVNKIYLGNFTRDVRQSAGNSETPPIYYAIDVDNDLKTDIVIGYNVGEIRYPKVIGKSKNAPFPVKEFATYGPRYKFVCSYDLSRSITIEGFETAPILEPNTQKRLDAIIESYDTRKF